MNNNYSKPQNGSIYEQAGVVKGLRSQLCPLCKTPMGDMPGTRDAYCPQCGYKDPCCE